MVLGLTLWGLFIALVAILGPRYTELFRDFGVQIPFTTRWFIELSEFMRSPITLGLVAAAPVAVLLILGASALRAGRGALIAMYVFALAALLPIAGFILSMTLVAARIAGQMQSGAGN